MEIQWTQWWNYVSLYLKITNLYSTIPAVESDGWDGFLESGVGNVKKDRRKLFGFFLSF
ncbi:hypothetical protein IGI57_000409 [Enterococcus sp. DIV0213j]|jgi:hypothetical protein